MAQNQNNGSDWEKDLEELGRALGKEMRGLGRELSKAINGSSLQQVGGAVGASLRDAAKELGRAAGQAGRSVFNAARAASGPARQERRRRKFFKKLRGDYEALKWSAFGLGLTAFILLAASFLVMLEGDSDWPVMWVLAAAFALPAAICKAQSYPALRLVNYHQALEGRSYCTVEELAATVDRPVYKTLREVRKMLQQGKFEGMYLAADNTRLFTNRTAYLMYNDLLASRQTAQAGQKEDSPERAAEAVGHARATVAELRNFAEELRREKVRMDDAAVVAQVQQLEDATVHLVAWVESHPEGEKKVRRFTGYYLPTTLKLLRTYNEVDAQADSSAVAADIQRDITGILSTINKAFCTLQDGLLQNTAMNVSAEISALETVLTQDGLADGEQLLNR